MKKEFWILTSFATIASIASSMVMQYIPIFGREIGMKVALVGFLVFVFYGMDTLARIPIGSFSDIIGYDKVVLIGGVAMILASVFYLLSIGLPKFLFLGQIFFGLGFSMTWVTIPSFITVTDQSLPKYTFFVSLGWLLGPLLGGWIRDTWDMYTLFIVFSGSSIILMLHSIGFYKFYSHKDISENEPTAITPNEIVYNTITSFRDAFKVLLKGGRVAIAVSVSFVMFMSFSMAFSLIPIYLGAIGLSSFLVGSFNSSRMGCATIIKLAVRKIIDKIGDVNALTIGMIGTGIPIFLIPLTEYYPLIILYSVIWGLTGGMYFPIVLDLIAKDTTKKERGVALGLRGTIGTLGSALGALIFSFLAEQFSINFSLQVVGIFVVIAAIVIFFSWKFYMKPKEG